MTYANRLELKYIIDTKKAEEIKKDLMPFVSIDKNGDKEGYYKVNSIYFDTPTKLFYREKVEGVDDRVKLRLRTYVHHDKKRKKDIILELKERQSRNIFKQKLRISEKDAKTFVEGGDTDKVIKKYKGDERKALCKVAYLKELHSLKPVVAISYDRQAFIGKYAPNLRITFDSNIRCRDSNFTFKEQKYNSYALLPKYVILEIKYCGQLPVWITQIIAKNNLQLKTFSKYCHSLERFINKQNGTIQQWYGT